MEKISPNEYVLFATGDINQELADLISAKLFDLDYINKVERKSNPITLIINSPGGSVTSAFQICDIMDYIDTPVYTTGVGLIASSALIILMNGEKGHRVISERSQILSHRYSWGVEGNHAELMAIQNEIVNTHKRIVNHYIQCTNQTKEILEKEILCSTDKWITPKEAIKYGLADRIYHPKKKKNKALKNTHVEKEGSENG